MEELRDVVITICLPLMLCFIILNMIITSNILDNLHNNENCIEINNETYCKMGGE